MVEIFEYTFLRHAFLAALLASITCGIAGTYIVSRRMVFLSGGITHSSFGGIGIAHFLGFHPILGAIVFSVLSALGIEALSKKTELREDSVIGIWWSFGMAIGILFIFITPGYVPNLMSYLFGSILSVSLFDLYLLTGIALLLIFFFSFFLKTILFIAFDQEYAYTHKAPVQLFNYLTISLVALTIVSNIKIVGIILVISLLTIPQSIANLFTRKFKNIILLSIVIGFAGSLSGLAISYNLDVPSGAAIIFSLIVLFVLAKLVKWISKRLIVKSL